MTLHFTRRGALKTLAAGAATVAHSIPARPAPGRAVPAPAASAPAPEATAATPAGPKRPDRPIIEVLK